MTEKGAPVLFGTEIIGALVGLTRQNPAKLPSCLPILLKPVV
jgi:hypothetical protein